MRQAPPVLIDTSTASIIYQSRSVAPDMPDYFVFWDEIVGRIRIHRADCGVCKYAKGMRERPINEERGLASDWEPAATYASACEIVVGLKQRKPALEKSAQTNCALCHPERLN
jgi:hypothetical protein